MLRYVQRLRVKFLCRLLWCSQGSNLRPLFFKVYLNDLLPLLDCKVVAYDDHLKIYCRILTIPYCVLLQENFDIVV